MAEGERRDERRDGRVYVDNEAERERIDFMCCCSCVGETKSPEADRPNLCTSVYNLSLRTSAVFFRTVI